jgi:hypothetical protein
MAKLAGHTGASFNYSDLKNGSLQAMQRFFGGGGSAPSVHSSRNGSNESKESSKRLEPHRPKLLTGDIRLRLGGVGRPGLLYKVVCILAVFFGFLCAGVGLARALPPVADGGEYRGLTILAAGAILIVTGIGFAISR